MTERTRLCALEYEFDLWSLPGPLNTAEVTPRIVLKVAPEYWLSVATKK